MDIINLIIPAFIIGLIVTSTHVPLGQEVLKRGIIFIDIAIAQIAGFGMVIAKLYFSHDHDNYYIEQLLAFSFAIIAAYFFMLTQKKLKDVQEAIIGSSYIFVSALTLLFLAKDPHAGEEIQNMFSGQILWVNLNQIIFSALIYALILYLWFFKRDVREKYFYFIFALTITISVQLIGVYLVFACLVIPALGALRYKNKLIAAYLISILSFLVGIVTSTIFDLPTGLLVVCVLTIISFIFFKLSHN